MRNMLYLNKMNSFFTVGNFNGYGCLRFGVSLSRFINSPERASTLHCPNRSVSKFMGTFGKKKLRINSFQPLEYYTGYNDLMQQSDAEEDVFNRIIRMTTAREAATGELKESSLNLNGILKELNSILANRDRPKEQLFDICLKLNSLELDVNITQLTQLLFYLSVLKINDEDLLMRITKQICNNLNKINKPYQIMNSFCKSIRKSLIRDTESLDKILEWYSKKEQNFSTTIEIICALAAVNYFPITGEILLQTINQSAFSGFSYTTQYFDFIWSLALLDRADEVMIHNILQNDFCKRLEYASSHGAQNAIFSKLTNIYGYSKIRGFKTNINPSWMKSDSSWTRRLKQKRDGDQNIKIFRDIIVHFFPLHTYSLSVMTKSGCIIDAVCYFNEESKPITEVEYIRNEKNIKLALLILLYHDQCFPDKLVPNGIMEFHRNYLESSGYKVLFLSYALFPKDLSLESKFNTLKDNIQGVLPNFRWKD